VEEYFLMESMGALFLLQVTGKLKRILLFSLKTKTRLRKREIGEDMRVYISADIEGIAGVNDWNDVRKNKGDYLYYQQLMMDQVIAACIGANKGGAKEIYVKDAHGSGMNLNFEGLPLS